MESGQLKYLISLMLVPHIGPKLVKTLIAYTGSPEAVFSQKKAHLLKIPGIGVRIAENIASVKDHGRAEQELAFINKYKIKALDFLHPDYPKRLRELNDAPALLFSRGNAQLNAPRMLAVVGTRKPSAYGKSICRKIVEDLAPFKVCIVSGLAYGIDTLAHQAAVDKGMATIGVLGHGLHSLYPEQNRSLARTMMSNGGLLTEYISGTPPDKENFPERNRIVAGMTDAVVIIETGAKGGSLITAQLSFSYQRDVLAIPGRINDDRSEGCNKLIKYKSASLVESAADIADQLGWTLQEDASFSPALNMADLEPLEKEVVELLLEHPKLDIDMLCERLHQNGSEMSIVLLNMEFKGILLSLPGKQFMLCGR